MVQSFFSGTTSTFTGVKIKDFQSIGGSPLLRKFNNSPYALLCSMFPEHEWLPWQFANAPKHYFDQVSNQKKFLEWAKNKLNKDWEKISAKVCFQC